MLNRKAIARIAGLSRRLGVYHQLRAMYDTVRPEARHQRRIDRALYGKIVSPGDLVFDIGANKGQKTAVFRSLKARVVALEPNPRAAEIIRRRYRGQDAVTVVEAAVGDAPGIATLHFRFTDTRASLRSDWHHFDYSKGETKEVEVLTLDVMIDRFGTPDFCKIDVEGYELNVVQGVSQPLPCLSLEFHDDERDRFLACMSHLRGLGPIEVNAIEMNGTGFLHSAWLAPEDFGAWLETDALDQGDIFIRTPRAD